MMSQRYELFWFRNDENVLFLYSVIDWYDWLIRCWPDFPCSGHFPPDKKGLPGFRRGFFGAQSRARSGTAFKGHWILSPTRLPIPPFGHFQNWNGKVRDFWRITKFFGGRVLKICQQTRLSSGFAFRFSEIIDNFSGCDLVRQVLWSAKYITDRKLRMW